MHKKHAVKWWHLAAITVSALPIVAIMPGCGGGSSSSAIQARQFTGDYTGTYTGSETGSLKYSVNNNNAVVAVVNSPSLGTVNATGQLNDNGNFSFTGSRAGAPATSISFSGSFNLINGIQTASGTWRTSNGLSGTFTTSKALGAATPTPGPTNTPGPTPTPTPTPVINQFIGRYSGSVTLNTAPITNDALEFTISSNGSIGGLLRQPDNSQINLAGSITNAGALSLTGSFTGSSGRPQTITLTGQIQVQNGATTVINAIARTSTGTTGTWAATKR